MKTKLFLLHEIELFVSFKMIYWTPMSGSYSLYGSILEKCGNFWKNGRFSGRIWPDWGNTARADMAGLGSIGNGFVLSRHFSLQCFKHFNIF